MSARLAAMAEQHYQEFMPAAYAALDDPTAFFARLGDDAQEQIEAVAEGLRGPDPEGEAMADRIARYNVARQTAESEVIREMILPAPEPQEPVTNAEDAASEAEMVSAVNDFQAAVQEFQDAEVE